MKGPLARAASAFPVLALLAGCAASPPTVDSCVVRPTAAGCSPEGWRRGLDRLAALRARSGGPRTERVALSLREPRTGRVLEARGAVAIAPPRALRMILLGPGGTTALDLWLAGDQYRFEVPAVSLVKRGDGATPKSERRGLPVDFLRSWLLEPAAGALLWYDRAPANDRFVLRDRGATVELLSFDDGRITAHRFTWSADGATLVDEEKVEASAMGCAEVRYHQASTRLDATVRCESEERGPPPERAFADPDGATP